MFVKFNNNLVQKNKNINLWNLSFVYISFKENFKENCNTKIAPYDSLLIYKIFCIKHGFLYKIFISNSRIKIVLSKNII